VGQKAETCLHYETGLGRDIWYRDRHRLASSGYRWARRCFRGPYLRELISLLTSSRTNALGLQSAFVASILSFTFYTQGARLDCFCRVVMTKATCTPFCHLSKTIIVKRENCEDATHVFSITRSQTIDFGLQSLVQKVSPTFLSFVAKSCQSQLRSDARTAASS
jgi:hypothetical protein